MQTVKLSSEYQVEIPARVRERIELHPGQEFKVHLHGDHILLVPVRRYDEDSATFDMASRRIPVGA